MQCVSIPTNQLAACAIVAPKADVRAALNGIYIEVTRDAVRATATDGHILLTTWSVPAVEIEHAAAVIIPSDFAAATLKGCRADSLLLSMPENYDDDVSFPTLAGVPFVAVDAKFPDWRAVIPSGEPAGEVTQFDVELLARLQKAFRKLTGSKRPPVIWPDTPTTAAIMTHSYADRALAVITPYRHGADAETFPADLRDAARSLTL